MIPYSCRVVTVNSEPDSLRVSRVRVNVVYERDLKRSQIHAVRRPPTPPPALQLEGYLNEPPAWAGEEVEVTEEPLTKVRITAANCIRPSFSFSAHTSSVGVIKSEDSYLADFPTCDDGTGYEGTSDYRYYDDQDDPLDLLDISPRARPVITQTICNICDVQVTTTQRRQHIYTNHLNKPLYKCPFCSYTSVYHKGNVAVHIKRKHRSAVQPTCLKSEYSEEIDQWMYRCFNDVRIFRCVDQDVVSVMQNLVDWVDEGRTDVPFVEATDNFENDLMPNLCDMPDDNELNHRLRPATRCNLCGMGKIKHLERHVLQYHVRRPMYFCPFCKYSSNYSASSVKEHIKARHSLTEKAEPVDTRDEHWQEIRINYEQCFGEEEDSKHIDCIDMKTMFFK